MRAFILLTSVAAVVLSFGQPFPVQAGCVISPDGSAIDMVTDNGASEEKNCAIKCRVETTRGIAQLSCGGNTPPLARGHSLCNYDGAPGYYKKVLSSEDSCKGGAGPAAAPVERNTAALPKAANPDRPSFTCRISVDGLSAEAVIANPYAQDTSCQVDCQIATTRGGATFSLSCMKEVAGGGAETVLCKRDFDKGKLVKMIGGKASCVKPLAANNDKSKKSSKKDEDDDDDDMPDQNEILRRMQRGEPMQNWMKK